MGKPQLTYLSLGWGVQSFCIAVMVANGDLPPIDVAVHSDTGHENQGTYAHAEKWTPWLEERGVKVVTVQPSENKVVVMEWADKGTAMPSVQTPAFSLRRKNGDEGQVRRQCTGDWKIRPIRRYIREQLGKRPRPGAVESWQGISLDEFKRMRSSDVKYIENVYPLVDRRITRADCVVYLEQAGVDIPPKSSCTFCPYHSLATWKNMKAQGGPDWDEAVAVDTMIREKRRDFTLYIHPARKPLEEAVRIPEDFGAKQLRLDDIPCDGGVCFV